MSFCSTTGRPLCTVVAVQAWTEAGTESGSGKTLSLSTSLCFLLMDRLCIHHSFLRSFPKTLSRWKSSGRKSFHFHNKMRLTMKPKARTLVTWVAWEQAGDLPAERQEPPERPEERKTSVITIRAAALLPSLLPCCPHCSHSEKPKTKNLRKNRTNVTSQPEK